MVDSVWGEGGVEVIKAPSERTVKKRERLQGQACPRNSGVYNPGRMQGSLHLSGHLQQQQQQLRPYPEIARTPGESVRQRPASGPGTGPRSGAHPNEARIPSIRKQQGREQRRLRILRGSVLSVLKMARSSAGIKPVFIAESAGSQWG